MFLFLKQKFKKAIVGGVSSNSKSIPSGNMSNLTVPVHKMSQM